MADGRHERLQRLRRAAAQLKRLEEMEMLRLRGRMEALQAQRHALLERLGQGVLGSGDLARMLRRNLQAMGDEQARLDTLLAEAMPIPTNTATGSMAAPRRWR